MESDVKDPVKTKEIVADFGSLGKRIKVIYNETHIDQTTLDSFFEDLKGLKIENVPEGHVGLIAIRSPEPQKKHWVDINDLYGHIEKINNNYVFTFTLTYLHTMFYGEIKYTYDVQNREFKEISRDVPW